jgi:hypothetical protein
MRLPGDGCGEIPLNSRGESGKNKKFAALGSYEKATVSA